MKEVFSPIEIDQFITDGFLRLDHAFSPEIAAAVRERLWKDIPDNRIQPVVRLGMYSEPPFIEAANTPLLHAAFDQLVGIGRWAPCRAMGTFPVRFPAPQDAGDTGWHVDVSFPGDDPANYFSWRSNISSKGRALLMLFLFPILVRTMRLPASAKAPTWMWPVHWRPMAIKDCLLWNWLPCLWTCRRGKKRWPPVQPVPCICVILFSYMRRNHIGERKFGSWRSRRCYSKARRRRTRKVW
ncbi:hypothetical protein MKQ70_20200 [Chitinophaga sedimenti]|uniref:hypothetical protein n=1 Tax=Chitinophaga sedimenti TaxID=2033606 RepID=UPI0020062082|nr:hypothetical protein [Chitinophaga sedimenti]MCK7557200.1 hypothetical protein [Chitinophaga sedimenti]